MSSFDLPEIRARLAAKEKGRRRGPRALRSLKALLSDEPQAPLLGRAEPPPMGPPRRPASPESDLLSAAAEPPIQTDMRRTTFGRRAEEAQSSEEPLLLLESSPPPFAQEPLLLLPPEPIPGPQSHAARDLLLQLEMRLLEEQAGLLAKIARRQAALICG